MAPEKPLPWRPAGWMFSWGNLMEVVEMITWQAICFAQLYFMRDTIPESKWGDYSVWKRSRTQLINSIVDEVQITLERFEPDEQPLSFFYSAFALLAILVS